MKKLICILLTVLLVFGAAACGDAGTAKERKRAAAGQDTTTASSNSSGLEESMDTGLLSPLDYTNAKSNKAGITYDPDIFMNLGTSSTGVKIGCVGDSITYGSLSGDPKTLSYPAQLANLLQNSFGSRYSVANYGHAGAYVADFGRENAATLRYVNTDEYRQLKKDLPDAVILMLGINDIGYLTDAQRLDTFTNSYIELINSIRALESKPVVYVCTPLVRVTAYSAYVTMPALCSAVAQAAQSTGSYLIDTYNITRQYFQTHLYDTDGLHPDAAGYKYLAETVYQAIVNGRTSYQAAETADTADYVVYVDSSRGSAFGVGASPDAPVSTFARAVDLCKGGGTIVVSGPVTPATTGKNLTKVFISQENSAPITVTSIDPYNGTDYRTANGARIFMSGSMYLNGDFVFKSVTFDMVSSAVKLVCNYNNITFGAGVSSTITSGGHSVLIVGHDVVSTWQSDYDLSCVKDCTVNIASGTFTYLRGGNYRTYSEKDSAYAYGTIKSGVTLTINVTGGTFSLEEGASNVNTADSRLSSVIGQNGMESGSAAVLNVSGGTFRGGLFAVPRMNPYYNGTAPSVAGSISIHITGGAFLGSRLDYLQTYPGAKAPTRGGAYALTISGGAFASSAQLSLSGAGSTSSVLTISDSRSYLKNWANITDFATVS